MAKKATKGAKKKAAKRKVRAAKRGIDAIFREVYESIKSIKRIGSDDDPPAAPPNTKIRKRH